MLQPQGTGPSFDEQEEDTQQQWPFSATDNAEPTEEEPSSASSDPEQQQLEQERQRLLPRASSSLNHFGSLTTSSFPLTHHPAAGTPPPRQPITNHSTTLHSDKPDPQRFNISRLLGLDRWWPWFWLFVWLVPNAFVALVYGVIPLGHADRPVFSRHGAWETVVLINPVVMSIIGYLTVTAYYECIARERPFRVRSMVVAAVWAVQLLVLVPLVHTYGYFRFLGLASLCLCYSTTFFGLWVMERIISDKSVHGMVRFFVVKMVILLNFVILACYVLAFREVSADIQPVLTATLAILPFILRKVLLSLTEPFPIEIAMLISGFWINNMNDMFQTLAYPSVKSPINYFYIWLLQFFTDVANLSFLTNPWFKFRTWIKAIVTLKWLRSGPLPKPNYEDHPNDRGQTNNHPGYRRRQARFYGWRLFSQIAALLFYTTTSSILRYGHNKAYFIFSEEPFLSGHHRGETDTMTRTQYLNSLLFVACYLFVTCLAGIAGWLLLKHRYKTTWEELRPRYSMLLRNRTYLGFVMAIICYNGLIAIGMLQYHQRIWWANL
ncbi:L-cystine transporter [Balamuthia mandrillaris]